MRSRQAVLDRMGLQMLLQSGLAASHRLPRARRAVPRPSQKTLAPSSTREVTRLHAASLSFSVPAERQSFFLFLVAEENPASEPLQAILGQAELQAHVHERPPLGIEAVDVMHDQEAVDLV